MPSSPEQLEPPNSPNPREGIPDRSGETTAKDLTIPLPEFLREIHAVLQHAEQAYSEGNLPVCQEAAEEGLALLRLPVVKNPIPPHYETFFRCFTRHPAYRAALGHYKQGLLHRRRSIADARADWQQSWDLLEANFPGYDERHFLVNLTHEFPIAGRVLRGVVRLRQKVREYLDRPAPPR